MNHEVCFDEIYLHEAEDDDDVEYLKRFQKLAITSIVITNCWGGYCGVMTAAGLIITSLSATIPIIVSDTKRDESRRRIRRYSNSSNQYSQEVIPTLGSGKQIYAGLLHQTSADPGVSDLSFPRCGEFNYYNKTLKDQHTTKHYLNVCGLRNRNVGCLRSIPPKSVLEILKERRHLPREDSQRSPSPPLHLGRAKNNVFPRKPVQADLNNEVSCVKSAHPFQRTTVKRTYSSRVFFLQKTRKKREQAAINLREFNLKSPFGVDDVEKVQTKPLKPRKPSERKPKENPTCEKEGLPPSISNKKLEKYLTPVIDRLLKGVDGITTPASAFAARLAEGTIIRPKKDSLEEKLSNVVSMAVPVPVSKVSNNERKLAVPSANQLALLVADLKNRVKQTQLSIHKMRTASQQEYVDVMKLPVSVCLPDGTSVEMLIGKSDSCFDVKKQISEETGLISFDVHYIGRVLSADEVLADTGLTEGEEIYIHPTIINNKLTTIPITGDQLITETIAGNISIAEELLKEGVGVNSSDQNGRTALYHAIKCDHIELVELLLQSGASPNKSDHNEVFPIQICCGVGSLDVLEFLISAGVHFNVSPSPLCIAVRNNTCDDFIRNLIVAGADDDDFISLARELNRTSVLEMLGSKSTYGTMQRVVKLFTLPQGDGRKDTIASLDCKENVVYIGTTSGLLQKWRLDQDSKDEDYVSRQLNQVQLKKRVVAQVITDPTWPRLFTLCDEHVTVHSSDDLSRVFYITEGDGKSNPLKGCICIAVAPVYKGTHRLCVATKRKLHLYNYRMDATTGQPSHTLFQVLVMPSSVCCLAFQGETLCCGYMKEYSLLNSYSGEATGLFTLYNQHPIIRSLDSEHAALCNVGNLSIRVSLKDAERKASPASSRITRETIKWSAEPRALGFKHPYIIGLLPDQVEIYSIYEGDIVQVLTNISGSILASVRCPGPNDNLCIATNNDVYMLVCADVDSQLKQLVSKLMMTEAFDMLYRTATGNEDIDQERMKGTHIDAGFGFLFRGQPDSAFEHFAATDIDVREILIHFPELLPPNAKEEGGVLYNWSSTIISNETTTTLEDRYIALLQDEPQRQSLDGKDSTSSNGLGASDPQLIFALEATMKQTINLLVLFMSARQESSDSVQQRCIGYASLVVAINHNNKEKTYALLTNRSCCELRECAPKLEESGLHRELALLYHHKHLHAEASQALRVSDKISVFCGEGIDNERPAERESLQTDLHEVFTAVESNDGSYVTKVLQSQPSCVSLADCLGNTPFHHACAISAEVDQGIVNDDDYMSMIGVLLNFNSDPNIKNKFGLTPLDVAKKASTKLWGFIISFNEVQQLCGAITPLKT